MATVKKKAKKKTIKKQLSAAKKRVQKTDLAKSKAEIQSMLNMGDPTVEKAQKAITKKKAKKKAKKAK